MELTTEQEEMTSEQLAADFVKNPTGSIVLRKKRRRAVKAKQQKEKQAVADSLINGLLWPKAVAEMSKDSFGRFVKVYLDGKAEIED